MREPLGIGNFVAVSGLLCGCPMKKRIKRCCRDLCKTRGKDFEFRYCPVCGEVWQFIFSLKSGRPAGTITDASYWHNSIASKAYPKRLAEWMVAQGLSTGHGDTFEDLLKELSWQIKELRQARTSS